MTDNTLLFNCTGIAERGRFPLENTGRGADCSPGFSIQNLSPDAQSLLITLEDLSHPLKGFTHWLIWNLPAASEIPPAIAHGRFTGPGNAVQGVAYGLHRYAGPKPPRGKTHIYRFTIYALDCLLDLSAGTRKKRVLQAARGHIIQHGSLTAHYE